jgi:hypothetical protein
MGERDPAKSAATQRSLFPPGRPFQSIAALSALADFAEEIASRLPGIAKKGPLHVFKCNALREADFAEGVFAAGAFS